MSTTIRFANLDDAAGILAIYSPYCDRSTISFEIVAPSVEQIAERIATTTAQYPWLVCEIDGEVAGYVYATKIRERAAYRWAVETAVYVATRHHRRRVGQALYSALFSILREQNYFRAYASITLPNPSSVRLHESIGFYSVGVFQRVGYKLDQWLDVGWWQLDLQPDISSPPEPRPIGAVRHCDAVNQSLRRAASRVQPAK